MSKSIKNFNKDFSDKDIFCEYERLNKEYVKKISKMLDDTSLRDNLYVFIEYKDGYMGKHSIEGIVTIEKLRDGCFSIEENEYVEDYTEEFFNIKKEDIEKLEQIKEELDKFYERFSSKLVLGINYLTETHYNPNNKEILIGLQNQLTDFIILSKYCNPNAEITGKEAISYLSFLLYHEYYHYLFDELNIGDSNLIDRELLTKDEIYIKVINKYKNEKMAWEFAKEWIGDNLNKDILNTLINTSMHSYSKHCKKALEQLNNPYSDYINFMGVVLVVNH